MEQNKHPSPFLGITRAPEKQHLQTGVELFDLKLQMVFNT